MNASPSIELTPVHRIKVTTLLDNYVDVLLASGPMVQRPPLTRTDTIPTDTLLAEHGLSLLVETFEEDRLHTVMLDTGYNARSLMHNMAMLDIEPAVIDALVVSHAHMDHAGALYPLVERMAKPVTLVAHPDIFSGPRILKTPDGRQLHFPQCYDRDRMVAAGIELVESSDPTPIAGGTITVTGEVARTTDFEKGMPNAFVGEGETLTPDLFTDDQSLVLHLQDKGLVLITGCCHAGIINTLHYARKITGIDKVYAVLGGLHLTAAARTPVMDKILEELLAFDPQVIIPMHCTGWESTRQIADAFPEAFILNSVGSVFTFE